MVWGGTPAEGLAGQVFERDDDQEADLNKRLSNVMGMRVECATIRDGERGCVASSSSGKVRRARRRNRAAPGAFFFFIPCAHR